MKDKTILEQLQNLGSIKASSNLHKKIAAQASFLQPKYRGFYFPLFAFRTGLVLSIVVVLLLIGSGFVWAAKLSSPGTPLYPVKQAIQTIAPQIIHPEKIPTIVPQTNAIPTTIPTQMISPTPTTKMHFSITGTQERENEREGNRGENETEVEGASAVQPTGSDQQNLEHDVKKQIEKVENTGQQILNPSNQELNN